MKHLNLRHLLIAAVVVTSGLGCKGMRGSKSTGGSGTASSSADTTLRPSTAVYSGCKSPPSSPQGRIFYADPGNGSMSNDGSERSPWTTLAEIVAAGKLPPSATAVVQPGDTLYLRAGNHGAVTLSSANSDFITITNAPNEVPTLTGLTVSGGSHWMISGLTIQNTKAVYGINVSGSDIVVSGNTILSQPDTSPWTQTDWQQNALTLAIGAEGNCVAITNNQVQNIRGGIGIGGTNILVRGNHVDHFGDDGIDFGQGTAAGTLGHIEISGNRITNNLDIGDANHNDGIQGWVLNGSVATDILIDGNTVIAQLDPTIAFPPIMQGISEFDGTFKNIRLINNLVIAAAYHGISLYGAQDSEIINNTVFGNWTYGTVSNETWIGVFNNKDNTPPSNVVVRNNVAGEYSLVNTGVVADHNVTSATPDTLFVEFNRERFMYDMRPQSASSLKGAGSTDLAPTVDITGAPRSGKITAGAYQ